MKIKVIFKKAFYKELIMDFDEIECSHKDLVIIYHGDYSFIFFDDVEGFVIYEK